MANSRIALDLKYMLEHPTDGIILCEYDNLRRIEAIITGPVDTPYETGLFSVLLKVPHNFPMSPFEARFTTPIFHPNVSEAGSICLDILDDEWYPSITLLSTLEAIQGLLANPNFDSPLNLYASRIRREGVNLYTDTVKTWTYNFAAGNCVVPHLEEKISILDAALHDRKKAIKELTGRLWDVDECLGELLP